MAPEDTSGRRQGTPVVLRIKLKYDSVEAMVHRFAPNVGKTGIFLPTKSIHPPGTEVKFELRLATDAPILVGLGRVQSGHEPDPANPRAIFGMAIEIIRVTREGRQILVRMIERRRAMGLPEVAIPIPADLDAARRADVETQPRAQIPGPGTSLLPGHTPTVLTAPRASPAPLAAAGNASDRSAALMLAPEPPRRVRRRVSAVIAAARQTASATPDMEPAGLLDSHVDVQTTVARARALASGNLDEELAALLDRSAAPAFEMTAEAASAELARHLGGAAVKRERSAPVAITTAVAADEPANAASVVDEQPAAQAEPLEPGRERDDEQQLAPAHREPTEFAVAISQPTETTSNRTPDPAIAPPEVANTDRSIDPPAETAIAVEHRAEPETSGEPASGSHRRTTWRNARRRTRGSIAPPIAATQTISESVPAIHDTSSSAETSATPASTVSEPLLSDASIDLRQADEQTSDSTDVASRHDPEVEPITNSSSPEAVDDHDDDPDLLSFERDLDAARVQTGVTITPAPPAPPGSYPDDDAPSASPTPRAAGTDEVDELDDADIQNLRIITPPSGVVSSAQQAFHADLAREVRHGDGEEVSDVDVLAEVDAEDDDLLHAHRNRELLVNDPPGHEVLHYDEAPLHPTPLVEPPLDAPGVAGMRPSPGIFPPSPVGDFPPVPSRGFPRVIGDFQGSQGSSGASMGRKGHGTPDEGVQSTIDDARSAEVPYYFSPAPEYLNPHRPAYETYDEMQTPYAAEHGRPHDPEDFDFASRLDLDDDSSEFDDRSSSYTFAERLPTPPNARRPIGNFDDPYGIGDSVRGGNVYGLDDALSNLDADPDPDDLPRHFDNPGSGGMRSSPGISKGHSIPEQGAQGWIDSPRRHVPLPGVPDERRSEPAIVYAPRPRRLITDSEGVVIDFDDDDDEFPE